MARTPANRSGKVLCHPSGERWTVELRLDENQGRQACQYTVYLNRVFAAETAARSAGEQVVAEWAAGRIAVRDLMLQELAATYRRLRETYQKMQPPAVPTTTSAWESAIGSWEELGWIAAADAARLREHVRQAFASEAGGMPRRGSGWIPSRIRRSEVVPFAVTKASKWPAMASRSTPLSRSPSP